MMKKMILEARINEYAMRDENPHVPWTADEIAETAARCPFHFGPRAATFALRPGETGSRGSQAGAVSKVAQPSF